VVGWNGNGQQVAGMSHRGESTLTSYGERASGNASEDGLVTRAPTLEASASWPTDAQCKELRQVCLPYLCALTADAASLQRSRAAYAAVAAAAEARRESGASAALHCRTEVPLLLAVHATDSWAAAVALLQRLPVEFGLAVSASAIAALGWAATLDDRVGAPGAQEVLAWLQRSCVCAGVPQEEPLLAVTLEHLRSEVRRAAREAGLAMTAPAEVDEDSGVDDLEFIAL
jgi:hypothetical protein